MAEEKFKLPRSSYEELVKIIKAYGSLHTPSSLEEISRLVAIGPSNISANNSFLIQIEVLERGLKKQATSKGYDLARALEHDMPDEIRSTWRRIVNDCEFLNKLVASVRIRNGMDELTLQSHIAYSAGEAKKGPVMTGARTVIDILRAAEVIVENDGKFIVNRDKDTRLDEGASTLDVMTPTQYEPERSTPTATVMRVNSEDTNIQIRVDVRVDCQFSELDELGLKLKRLIESLKDSVNVESSDDNQ